MLDSHKPFALVFFASDDGACGPVTRLYQLLDGIKPIATFGSFCAVARHAMLKEDWSHVLAKGYRVLSRESLKAHHGQLGDTKQGYQQSHRVDSV